MTAALPILLQYGVPYAIKGVSLLAAYIAGRVHQKQINAKTPKMARISPAAAARAYQNEINATTPTMPSTASEPTTPPSTPKL